MKYNQNIHHRHSIRLKHFNYSQNGYYFVTICTKDHGCWFGDIADGKMILNQLGNIVETYWDDLPKHFNNVSLDKFIMMPNHLHGIVVIENPCRGGVTPPLRKCKHFTLGQIVGYFKYQSTKHINKIMNSPGKPFWQRNYYEHIIRNEHELNQIRGYIVNNPLKWEFDTNNPKKLHT